MKNYGIVAIILHMTVSIKPILNFSWRNSSVHVQLVATNQCQIINKEINHCHYQTECSSLNAEESRNSMVCLINRRAPKGCCHSESNQEINDTLLTRKILLSVVERQEGNRRKSSTTTKDFFPFVDLRNKTARDVVQVARLQGLRKVFFRERQEEQLLKSGLVIRKGSPSYLHQSFLKSSPETLKLTSHAILQDEIHKVILSRLKKGMGRANDHIAPKQMLSPNNGACRPQPCSQNQRFFKYRTIDGSCNNLQNALFGQAATAFQRILPPFYSDGFSRPRIAVDGGPLPSGRIVSLNCLRDFNRPSNLVTLMLMNWGQFLNHDITLTPLNALSNGAGIRCCGGMQHQECFPIEIPSNDPFYSTVKVTCMEFVRSLPAVSHRKACEFGFRDQMNEVTSYIDGSVIYGSSNTIAQQVRNFQNGRLRTVNCFGKEYLPFVNGNASNCFQPFQTQTTGDIRMTEQIHLVALHTILVREHNRLAKEFLNLNPHWTDEILYQEARRLVAAIMQHITYNEYLPILLGKQVMTSLNLMPLTKGHSTDYNPNINAGIFNEFAAAANRFGHSLIQSTLDMMDDNDTVEGTVKVRDQFSFPVPLYFPKNMDRVLRGITKQPIQLVDPFISLEVTRHLYQTDAKFGLDLAAVNIQRGRDHGLPGYNAYRQFCGLRRANTFEDLMPEVEEFMVQRFKSTYRNVNDIDLWVGILSERPLKGAIVGPTLGCLLVEQYWRLKLGDRYWYEFKDSPGAFTSEQLQEIRKITLARLLCDNGDGIFQMQPLVFIQPTDWNPRTPCNSSDIPRIDLNLWKEKPT